MRPARTPAGAAELPDPFGTGLGDACALGTAALLANVDGTADCGDVDGGVVDCGVVDCGVVDAGTVTVGVGAGTEMTAP